MTTIQFRKTSPQWMGNLLKANGFSEVETPNGSKLFGRWIRHYGMMVYCIIMNAGQIATPGTLEEPVWVGYYDDASLAEMRGEERFDNVVTFFELRGQGMPDGRRGEAAGNSEAAQPSSCRHGRAAGESKTVLVVEERPEIALRLKQELAPHKVRISSSDCIQDAVVNGNGFDLIVFDLGNNPEECLQCIAGLQDRLADTPFIALHSIYEEAQCIRVFEAGADDYVLKYTSARVLGLRILAILKRNAAHPDTPADEPARTIVLDEAARKVHIGGRQVHLTFVEFRLLASLYRAAGKQLTRRQLIDDVWGTRLPDTSRRLDTGIRRLRVKLGAHAALVETVYGLGYRFVPSPREDRA